MTYEELKHWLATNAPADPAEVARVAVGAFDVRDGGGGSRSDRAFGIIRTYWLPRFPAVDVGDLLAAVTDAVEATRTAEKAQETQREAARRESGQKADSARLKRIAAERKAAEERAARAERVKRVTERLGVCDRQARSLVTHGTTIRQRAEQLAEVLGGEPRDYMRRRARPGRQPDLAGWFMRVRAEGLSFQDYADTFPELEGRAKEALEAIYGAGDDFRDFEQFTARASDLGVSRDAAAELWARFKLWRIEAVADRATMQVEETLEREYDFG